MQKALSLMEVCATNAAFLDIVEAELRSNAFESFEFDTVVYGMQFHLLSNRMV